MTYELYMFVICHKQKLLDFYFEKSNTLPPEVKLSYRIDVRIVYLSRDER